MRCLHWSVKLTRSVGLLVHPSRTGDVIKALHLVTFPHYQMKNCLDHSCGPIGHHKFYELLAVSAD